LEEFERQSKAFKQNDPEQYFIQSHQVDVFQKIKELEEKVFFSFFFFEKKNCFTKISQY